MKEFFEIKSCVQLQILATDIKIYTIDQ